MLSASTQAHFDDFLTLHMITYAFTGKMHAHGVQYSSHADTHTRSKPTCALDLTNSRTQVEVSGSDKSLCADESPGLYFG